MKFLAIIALVLSTVIGRAEIFPKNPLEIGGKKYLYSDCLTVTTGMGGKHLHHIVVHLDEVQYSDLVLWQSDKGTGYPRLSSGTIDLPLTSEGVYLVRKIEGVLRVDYIAGDPPMTEEKKAVETYVRASVMKPPMPPEQK